MTWNNSIIYLKGYIGINTLINIKKYIGGEVLDFLNSLGPDFSLKQIGDFVDNLMDEIETKNLDEAEAKILVNDSVKNQLQKIEQLQQGPRTTQPLDPLGLRQVTETNQLKHSLPAGVGGKNNRISNPKQNTKYRKKYKKFVSKYIIKKNRKSNKKNNKNKTRKNRKLPKSKPKSKSKYANKTLKNKKRKTKPNKHKSKQNNKKTKTNYYNYYKHNKTLKH